MAPLAGGAYYRGMEKRHVTREELDAAKRKLADSAAAELRRRAQAGNKEAAKALRKLGIAPDA